MALWVGCAPPHHDSGKITNHSPLLISPHNPNSSSKTGILSHEFPPNPPTIKGSPATSTLASPSFFPQPSR